MHTDVKTNKEILKHCPNYYKIKDYDFEEEDYISQKLIQIFEEYVFNVSLEDKESLKIVKCIDQVLLRYIEDFDFRGELGKGLVEIKVKKSEDNVVNYIVKELVSLYEKYLEGYTRNLYIPRWI